MDTTKFGSFDDLLDISPPSQHAAMRRLRAIILEVDPAACEVVRLGDRAATYGVGPKKMSEGYAYIMKIRSLDAVESPAIRALVVAALEERRGALGR